MSMTIYGNITKNGVFVDGCVDNSNDIIYPFKMDDSAFARISYARENVEEPGIPAITIFHKNDLFNAVWGKAMVGYVFEDFVNEII